MTPLTAEHEEEASALLAPNCCCCWSAETPDPGESENTDFFTRYLRLGRHGLYSTDSSCVWKELVERQVQGCTSHRISSLSVGNVSFLIWPELKFYSVWLKMWYKVMEALFEPCFSSLVVEKRHITANINSNYKYLTAFIWWSVNSEFKGILNKVHTFKTNILLEKGWSYWLLPSTSCHQSCKGPRLVPSAHPGRQNTLSELCFLNFFPLAPTRKVTESICRISAPPSQLE